MLNILFLCVFLHDYSDIMYAYLHTILHYSDYTDMHITLNTLAPINVYGCVLLVWEETGVSGGNPPVQLGDHLAW